MKRLTWVFALLPLLAMGLFYLAAPPVPKKAPSDQKQSAQTSRRPFGAKRPPISVDPLEFNPELKRLLEARKESGKRSAARLTPEVIRDQEATLLRRYEPYYLGLFSTWDIDAKTVDDVMKIIQERNEKQTANVRDFSAEGLTFANEFKKRQLLVATDAENKLSQRLGRKRFDELSEMEAQMKSDSLAASKARFARSSD